MDLEGEFADLFLLLDDKYDNNSCRMAYFVGKQEK